MKTLVVDMDEVAADVVKKFKALYWRDHKIKLNDEQLKGKNIKEAVAPEHSDLIHRYLNTPGFFRDLDLISDADMILNALNQKYELYMVSAAMEFPNSLKDKYEWIMEKLPFITWRQIYLCGKKSIVQADIMLDDRTRNFHSFKGRKILFTAHHNIYESDFERVNNWQDVGERLL